MTGEATNLSTTTEFGQHLSKLAEVTNLYITNTATLIQCTKVTASAILDITCARKIRTAACHIFILRNES